jgi:histidyl-tRNA synthetase
MGRPNKAHTATANRIAYRYGAEMNTDAEDGEIDIRADGFSIAVETTATLEQSVRRWSEHDQPIYVAVTNREALGEALRLVADTRVGVMDPQGIIVKEAAPP